MTAFPRPPVHSLPCRHSLAHRLRILWIVVAFVLLTGLRLGIAPITVQAQASSLLPCDDLLGCIEIPAGQPVVVGGLFDRTGAEAVHGLDQAQAVALAIQDFGSVLGHAVMLREQDIDCLGAIPDLRNLMAVSTLVGFVGPSCNGAARVMLRHHLHGDLPLLSPAATDNTLFVTDRLQGGLWQPGFLTTAPNDLHQGVLLAHHAFHTLGIRRLVVVDDAQTQRTSLREAMEAAFRIYGGRIMSREVLTPGTGPVMALLERVAALQPDALYLPVAHQDARRLALAIGSMPSLQHVHLLVSADWLTMNVAAITRTTDLKIHAAGPYVEPGQASAFGQRWLLSYPHPPATFTAAHAYDATSLLLQAVRLTARQDTHGNLSLGRLALRQALQRQSGFPGYTGVLACTALGQCTRNEAWGLYRLPARDDTRAWPPVLLQAPHPAMGRNPQYRGRILQDTPVRSGPADHLPALRTLTQHSTVQIMGIASSGDWVQMTTGGWLPTGHLELYRLGLPVVSTPVAVPTPAPIAPQVGSPAWPVPQDQSFPVPDGMSLRVMALLQEGDPGYASSVPPYRRKQPQCPHCGHIAVRVGLQNTSAASRHRIYTQDFSLHRTQDREGFPARIEASALPCQTRTLAPNGTQIYRNVGEVPKVLCFAVPDVTRVAWMYNLVYESARDPQAPPDTSQAEFTVHFSLR